MSMCTLELYIPFTFIRYIGPTIIEFSIFPQGIHMISKTQGIGKVWHLQVNQNKHYVTDGYTLLCD